LAGMNRKHRQAANGEMPVFTIHPGETIRAMVHVDRVSHKGEIQLGKEFSGRNMPFGVFVDNIGLSGLLVTPDASQREFFISASPVAAPTRRMFFLKSNVSAGITSPPALLVVQP
ncbi:MAG: hypothetical protein AAFP90_04220, partial [Planctomycetota bacterium]